METAIDELRFWGPVLPLAGDPVSVNCLAETVIRQDDGTERPDHLGRVLILAYDVTANLMRAVCLKPDQESVITFAAEGPGWVRVFKRVVREMDYADFYDGRRGGAFPPDEDEA